MSNDFGTFLKAKRQEKNITQKELANSLFVSESAVSKWEKNVAHPDISLLPKLAEILSVSEHELITASIDANARKEKSEAKKWRVLSFSWNLFFYVAYITALIPCFICNLVVDKKLSWFWIVLSSLLLAFTFTNLPGLIKKHRLILIPSSMYLSLCLLLGICSIYTHGAWFFIAIISVLLGLTIIFSPIYITRYKIFNTVKKYADFASLFIDFIVLNILLIVINIYTSINYSSSNWYLQVALPIVVTIYLLLNIFLCVRFLKINKLLKTSVILFMINLIYLVPTFVKVNSPDIQKEIDDSNILKANLSTWNLDTIDNNVHLIIYLAVLLFALTFLIIGLILKKYSKK